MMVGIMTNLFILSGIVILVCTCLSLLKKKKYDGYKAALALLEQGYNIFVTGGAGTGKSYILNKLKKHYKSNLSITSTTGISALNVNGQTIHSWSGIGIANTPIEQTIKRIKDKNSLYSQILCAKMLAIDEISMLDNKTLDYINETLKAIRNNSRPFGGIQVLLFGDFFQLPPVKLGENGCDFCFNSDTWQELDLKPVLLSETKRQTEKEFIDALNNIRVGFVTPEDTQMFKQREKESQDINTNGILHIFGTNEEADTYNSKCFDEVQEDIRIYNAEDTFYLYDRNERCTEIKITDETYPNLHDIDKKIFKKFNDDCKAPQALKLKLNSRVMLIKNVDVKAGLVNGSCGTIIELNPNSIVVLFDDGNKHKIEKMEFLYQKDALPKIKRLQYPLRLAYGITIHKSQGMTFDNLVVNFDRVFSDGQGYVALSRTRSLQGLILNSYAPGKVTANPEVVEFYRQLEKYGFYKVKQNSSITKDTKREVKELTNSNIENNINSTVASKFHEDSKNYLDSNKEKNNIYINMSSNNKPENLIDILNSNKIIEIEYISFKDGEEIITKRRIKPLQILSGQELNEVQPLENGFWDDKAVYIRAYCYLRDEERTFKLDRIKSMYIVD